MSYKNKYKSWLEHEYFDVITKDELRNIESDEKEIEDRFYTELEFGTAGLRGVIGAGTNRMNIYVVRKATQGFANYLTKVRNSKEPKVAIAYDSRNMSYEFAKEAGAVFAANGIHVYIFESLRPVPELSFAVRELKCHGGVVITASHNPPEYNGYKVYGEDGAQVIAPYDQMIIEEVNKITDFNDVKHMSEEEAVEAGLLTWIGQEVDDKYIEQVKKQAINLEVIQRVADDFKIVYTPIHGTGNKPVRRILSEVGFKNVYVVDEQAEPNGNFPTVKSPNPEDTNAFALAIELAKKVGADIVMGTDPDADRVGVLIRDQKGEYVVLTGNMMGAMLADYIVSQKKLKGELAPNSVIIKTIVTTEMTRAIAKSYGAEVIEVLTGFKYIGEQIRLFEEKGDKTYVFGFEESYGCLAGTYARDKDAVVACMLSAEMAAYYKDKGMTLYEALISLYEKYGYYKEGILSITLKGIEGMGKIKDIMGNLRALNISTISSYTVLAKRDYETSKRLEQDLGEEDILLPKSDVLYYELDDNAWVCIRPSGTEPKIKFYFGVKGSSIEDADAKVETLENAVKQIIEPWL
ncbi:phospho-sugar mutase [Cellulosilyticum sp. I15G10I2]|uniref:phospho-sugar mutase n=1 Tax=Cellulosilyticum sp. I15G10I2 TaxID=1892843 RepID=UPI00085C8A5E|nr:phospho-sugar mutase [Cellulosilyticum sp. I15G10I2]